MQKHEKHVEEVSLSHSTFGPDSVTRFTHKSCTGARLSGIPKAAVKNIEATSPMLEEIKYLRQLNKILYLTNMSLFGIYVESTPLQKSSKIPHLGFAQGPNHGFHVFENGSALLHCSHNG